MNINLKRVYVPPSEEDGLRVLVDRLWPRGVSKKEAQVDLWVKELAPSDELRRWFGHDRNRWAEFKRRYFIELDHKAERVQDLLDRIDDDAVTFVFAARDEQANNATALREYLLDRFDNA
jgi:uncharacterized protein YeaO (DUF488 family)